MQHSIIPTTAAFLLALAFPFTALGQMTSFPGVSGGSVGDITGGGSSGWGGSGTGSSGGGSSSSTGSSGSSSSSSAGSSSGLGSDVSTPTFQGFEELGTQNFIGVNSSSSFVGVDEIYSDRQSSRTSTAGRAATTSTSRRTTSSRTTAGRTTTGRSATGTTSGGREVRSQATADIGFSPMEVDRRQTAFRSRMARLPNLSVIPDKIDVAVTTSGEGTVATLTGTVPTERDRKLVRHLLLLEPGIDRVDNRLIVSAGAESLPTLD